MFPHEVAALKAGLFLVQDQAVEERANLQTNCWVREQSSRLRAARVGSREEAIIEAARGDDIAWLTDDFSTDSPGNNPLFELFRQWRTRLEYSLGFSSTRVSIQLSRYSREGARYVRHSDVNRAHGAEGDEQTHVDQRLLTLVYYLNPSWTEQNGGRLRAYHAGCEPDGYFDIDPINNRLIIFPSTLEHEVMPSFGIVRWAVTMWIYASSPTILFEPRISTSQSLSVHSPDSIFVSIASYCDPDVINTINDMISNASHPDRLTFGVCWQGDAFLDFSTITRRQQVRWTLLTASEACGPLFARNVILERLYQGQRFLFQVDAHTRVAKGWDVRLIAQLAVCPSPKPVITAYPPGFEMDGSETRIEERLLNSPTPLLCADRFDHDGFLRIIGRELVRVSETTIPCRFWAAGYSFSEARAFFGGTRPNVPYLFFGEEVLMSLYLFCHGWDFFCPTGTNIVFHYWKSRSQRPQTALRVTGENRLRVRSAYAQILSAWRADGCSPKATRSVRDYEDLAGVDFSQRTVEERAKLGGQESWTSFRIAAALPPRALALIERFL